MKKINIVLLILICLLFNIKEVYAADPGRYLCSYEQKNMIKNKEQIREIRIMYYFDSNKWSLVSWTKGPNNKTLDVQTKSNSIFSNVFSSSGSPNVYMLSKISGTTFKCPKYAYWDNTMFAEYCFDDDGKSCKNKSGTGTKFADEDDTFISTKRTNDNFSIYASNAKSYLNSWKITCNDINESANGNIIQNLIDKFWVDFGNSYFGYKISSDDIRKSIVNSNKLDLKKQITDKYSSKNKECNNHETPPQPNDSTSDSTTSGDTAFEEALEKARNDGNTCVYIDENKKNIYGYKVSSGVLNNTANYKFYLLDGKASSKTLTDKNVAAIYDKNKCNPYAEGCLNDTQMKFFYKSSKNQYAITSYGNTNCEKDKTNFELDNPYMSQDSGITQATQDYKCVYRDENNTLAGTDLKSTLGTVSVKILRYKGNISNEVIEVANPKVDDCPKYFLYAKQSDEGSFGGTGNTTFYSQFGNDFDELCKIAKKNNREYDVLTLNTINIEDVCSSSEAIEEDSGNQEIFGDASNVTNPPATGIDFCSRDGVKQVMHIIGYLLFSAKIAVPLLLIVMGSMDFGKALTSSDDKSSKDAFAKLIKRVIAGVIIFFIPTVFDFLLGLVDGVTNNQTNFTDCSKCLFTPISGECSYTKIGSKSETTSEPEVETPPEPETETKEK